MIDLQRNLNMLVFSAIVFFTAALVESVVFWLPACQWFSHGLACSLLFVKFLPPCCCGSAGPLFLLTCAAPMGIAFSTVDFYALSFYHFLVHFPVCFSIYKHSQCTSHSLSNFLVSLRCCSPMYYLYSVSKFLCASFCFI